MDDEPKKEEDVWSVEPPKEGGGKAGKVLRVALIVAALAAATAMGVMWFGEQIRLSYINMTTAIGGEVVCAPVVSTADEAEAGRTEIADRIVGTGIE